jgi:multicomponent Na+:H+ antiporter subunit B
MKSLILRTASSYLLPLLLLFSFFVLFRGHYHPGGGFVGGLIASIAFILHFFANGLKTTKQIIRIHPGILIPIGLALSLSSGLFPMLADQLPFMTGVWMDNKVPVLGSIGTAFFFDTGVYIVVLGITLTIVFTISENV